MKLFKQPQVFDLNPNVFWIQVGIEWLACSFHWFFLCWAFFLPHQNEILHIFWPKLALQHSSQKNFSHGASISNHIHFHVAFLATWPWQGRKSSTPFESIALPRGWWIMPLTKSSRRIPCQFSLPRSVVLPTSWSYNSSIFTWLTFYTCVSPSHSARCQFFWELMRLYNVKIFSSFLSSPLVL